VLPSVDSRPIGVFDSGVGGLTVLAALEAAMPSSSLVYLGDTARLPYGTKSSASVERYALQCAAALVRRDVRGLVVACNTASAAALPSLRAAHPGLPVFGVIDPGAEAALAATRSGRIVVLATEGTVRAEAYQRAIAERDPTADVAAIGCSVFVALAEEGWGDGDIAERVARQYLGSIFESHEPPDTLLLGCTHFPLLRRALERIVPPSVTIVDSAQTTALAVADVLGESGSPSSPRSTLLATDGPERFARVGSLFLGRVIHLGDVERVDV
jgi:glutamate racemase